MNDTNFTLCFEDILGAVARGWCHEDNAYKTMDVELAKAIGDEVWKVIQEWKK